MTKRTKSIEPLSLSENRISLLIVCQRDIDGWPNRLLHHFDAIRIGNVVANDCLQTHGQQHHQLHMNHRNKIVRSDNWPIIYWIRSAINNKPFFPILFLQNVLQMCVWVILDMVQQWIIAWLHKKMHFEMKKKRHSVDSIKIAFNSKWDWKMAFEVTANLKKMDSNVK